MSLILDTPRRAFITGAGSGIGRGIAVKLALEHGWEIIATDLNLVSVLDAQKRSLSIATTSFRK